MPILLQYLLKLSISLAVLYIFYRAVLRPLTFYQCNRFYLAGYVLLSFIIPFINIDPWIKTEGPEGSHLIGFIPSLGNYTQINTTVLQQPAIIERLTLSDWIIIFFSIGAVTMLVRFVVQYISLRRIRSKAVLLEKASGVMVYETNAHVSPFSFGSAVYFNRNMQSEEELERIIQHEFVHVKQKHTIDLVIGELLCIVNWYNPFAWLIRHAIRQNLEFIADNNVLENGLDRKEYQYLLLKVMGVPRFSIANNFNFSNLKKRIAMMNKMKSTKVHLTKFLFVLPLLMVILVAFRNREIKEAVNSVTGITVFADTVPKAPPPPALAPVKEDEVIEVRGYRRQDAPYNSKGYKITIADNDGECVVVVKDRNKKIVKAVALTDWDASMEATYGKIPPAPPPPPPAIEVRGYRKLPKEVKTLKIDEEKAEVALSNGKQEVYDLSVPAEKAAFEKKYGKILPVTPDGLTPPVIELQKVTPPVIKKDVTLQQPRGDVKGLHVDGTKAKVVLANGTTEKYDLAIPAEKAAFEKKYGDIPKFRTPATIKDVEITVPAKESEPVEEVVVRGYPIKPLDGKLYVVNGVAVPKDAFSAIEPGDIMKVDIVKGDQAIGTYGPAGRNGVVSVTTRPGIVVPVPDASQRQEIKLYADTVRMHFNNAEANNVLIIVDDKEYAPGTFDFNSIKPEDIKSVHIFKDENATKVYGEKGKNGVIKIKTKNGKTPVPVTAAPRHSDVANDNEVIVVGYGTKKNQ